MLDVLPAEILIKILKYLDYKDLVKVALTNNRLRETANCDELWKIQSDKYWNNKKLNTEDTDWKSNFIRWYKANHRYIDCYKDIKDSWDKINAFMSENYPEAKAVIKDGATEKEIKEAETKLGLEFPDDFRCSLTIHNGQRLTTMGLYGGVNFQNHFRSEYLLDLDTVTTVQSRCYGCVMVTIYLDTGVAQCLALKDTNRNHLKKGTVFYPSDIDGFDYPLFSAFITANSYGEWLKTFANQLKDDEFLKEEGQLLRFPKCNEVSEWTQSICVSVRTSFLFELSSILPPKFFHTYKIRMRMDEEAPKSQSCQLETRHWTLIDENGLERHIQGQGVVGEFPIMRPGSDFTWTSAASLKTTLGIMKGFFTMKNLQTGEKMKVTCPAFHMKCLPYVCPQQFETSYLDSD